MLKNTLDIDSAQADILLDLGRYSLNAKERLAYFKQAREYGSNQPNLPVWILTSALEAHDDETVGTMVSELSAFMETARKEYGNKLDWAEKTDEIWEKAFQSTGDRKSASALVRAITTHAEYKHYVHTALGHSALKNGDIGSAINHLSESGSIAGTPRLSSYGPSFSLAKALCHKKEWEAVKKYLESCGRFWDDKRLPEWIAEVESHHIPEFDG